MTAIKSAIFTILVPGTVAVIVPWIILGGMGFPKPAPALVLRFVGATAAIAGLALYFRCLSGFVGEGGGTPSPSDPPRRLVVRGPYRRTRNPMYLAVCSVVVGEALAFGSFPLGVYAAALGLVFHLFVVCYEEPTLGRLFGEEYQAYRRAVPRWLGRSRRPPDAAGN
jgi:protein-S-isoprenylcysteine O-methyltransferase Ste14